MLDKPTGPTSHDLVGAVRRAAGTRRVGHAGTLDPGASGVLVVGLGVVTRLLGHLTGHDKSYDATVRLGAATTTDDAAGEPTGGGDASGLEDERLHAAVASLRGPQAQVPSAFSAVQVGGVRSYARARAGEEVRLEARQVTVLRADVRQVHRGAPGAAGPGTAVDVDVRVVVSAGTYVRALARDLGVALGVGGHLVALRRTAAGPFGLDAAVPVSSLDDGTWRDALRTPEQVAAAIGPVLRVDAEQARRVGHGQRLAAGDVEGAAEVPGGSTACLVGPAGLVALAEVRAGVLRPGTVLAAVSW